jgi:hypothetical protein
MQAFLQGRQILLLQEKDEGEHEEPEEEQEQGEE